MPLDTVLRLPLKVTSVTGIAQVVGDIVGIASGLAAAFGIIFAPFSYCLSLTLSVADVPGGGCCSSNDALSQYRERRACEDTRGEGETATR